MTESGGVRDLPEMADRVLAVVDQIPPGRVATYGDIGVAVGCGPRQVGQVMSRYGSAVCWWRVLRADGRPPQGLHERALQEYRQEQTPMSGDRVLLSAARFQVRPPRAQPASPEPDGQG